MGTTDYFFLKTNYTRPSKRARAEARQAIARAEARRAIARADARRASESR